MRYLEYLAGRKNNDPYVVGLRALQGQFFCERWYVGQTEAGFRIRYRLGCVIKKMDFEKFRAARMLEESEQKKLIDDWHQEVFCPAFVELGCSFRLLMIQGFFFSLHLCRPSPERPGELLSDQMGLELEKDINKISYERNGCTVVMLSLRLEFRETQLLEENYNMISIKGRNVLEESAQFKAIEEATIIVCERNRLKLEKEFQANHQNQEHECKHFVINTQSVSGAIEITWKLKDSYKGIIRGYRNESGFYEAYENPKNDSICIVEARTDGKTIQQLVPGRECFYLFHLISEEPIYAPQGFLESLFSSATVTGNRETVVDVIRFSVRVPTEVEVQRVDRLFERFQGSDSKREKINQALKELTSFVEFDESLSQWEKDLTKRIKAMGYSSDEEADKIERLRGVIEALRVGYK